MAIELSSKTEESVEMVELFSVDDQKFFIPKKPRVNVALKFLKKVRTDGAEAASAYLLEALLGEEAYDALSECESLTAEDLSTIVDLAQKITLGGLDK